MEPSSVAIPSELCSRLCQLQQRIEGLYRLEAGPRVCDFVRLDENQRYEAVFVKQEERSTLELLVVFPADIDPESVSVSDNHLQLIEGVSHFVHLSERARTELPTTELELELQAEVDKFALLAESRPQWSRRALHQWLFGEVTFVHDADTTMGRRYRLANELAARLWSRLVERNDASFTKQLLRRFYRLGQADKLSLIAAV